MARFNSCNEGAWLAPGLDCPLALVTFFAFLPHPLIALLFSATLSIIVSRNLAVPMPCRAETGKGSPSQKDQNSAVSMSLFLSLSHSFKPTCTGTSLRNSASSRSMSIKMTWPSMTSMRHLRPGLFASSAILPVPNPFKPTSRHR